MARYDTFEADLSIIIGQVAPIGTWARAMMSYDHALWTWAQNHASIARLYVFGSRAKGTARPDSDLDVAIELNGSTAEALTEFHFESDLWRAELGALTGLTVDLQLFLYEETPTISAALAECCKLLFVRR